MTLKRMARDVRPAILSLGEDGRFALTDPPKPGCGKYAHGCKCGECMKRAARPKVVPIRQPWETEAA